MGNQPGGGLQGVGKVEYPAYISATHSELMYGDDTSSYATAVGFDVDMQSAINTMAALTNPYTDVAAYDPEPHLADIRDSVRQLLDAISGFDEFYQWEEAINTATQTFDADIDGLDDHIDDRMDQVEAAAEKQLAKSYNRVTAGFYDANAVCSTTFTGALALLESDHDTSLADQRAKMYLALDNAMYDRKAQYLVTAGQVMSQLSGIRLTGYSNVVQSQMEVTKLEITANMGVIDQDLDFNLKEIAWDVSLVERASGIINATQGVQGMSNGTPPGLAWASTIQAGANLGLQTLGIAAGVTMQGANALATGFGGLVQAGGMLLGLG